ncbi:MAG: hypothetical protein ACXWQR_16190 [Ktedonobacterales bacterium]
MSGKRFSDIIRVRLDAPLPCGMKGCARRTTSALVERDPAIAGLWQLLPICKSCQSARSEQSAALVDKAELLLLLARGTMRP